MAALRDKDFSVPDGNGGTNSIRLAVGSLVVVRAKAANQKNGVEREGVLSDPNTLGAHIESKPIATGTMSVDSSSTDETQVKVLWPELTTAIEKGGANENTSGDHTPSASTDITSYRL